jgi:endoglucanase
VGIRTTTRAAAILGTVLATGALALTPAAAAPAPTAAPTTTTRTLAPNTSFYVDLQSKAAAQAITDVRAGQTADAVRMAELASWPVATWFTGGTTPAQTRTAVATLAARAAGRRQVPVITAYNVPGRDCSQFSAGGAATTAEYQAWADGLAAGLGRSKAVVILEPDGLALSPDQCGGTPQQQADRVAQINYAVDRLEQQPDASVYIDAGHSAWHAVGDMAQRLRDGGIARAQGFFLNVSNYRTDAELTRYGTMIAGCLWYLANVAGAVGDDCANQFWPPADADAWYAAHVPAGAVLTHFVIDSSRNGQGPWTPPAGVYSDPQDWCNPPARGIGRPPTADTGTPLVDAYLWVKVPGESDGSCTRGTAGPVDPEWGVVDPAAGVWWPDQVHQLAALASPALTVNPHALLGTR